MNDMLTHPCFVGGFSGSVVVQRFGFGEGGVSSSVSITYHVNAIHRIENPKSRSPLDARAQNNGPPFKDPEKSPRPRTSANNKQHR